MVFSIGSMPWVACCSTTAANTCSNDGRASKSADGLNRRAAASLYAPVTP